MILTNTLINDDCFNVFLSIPDKSIDLILCDLPYAVTQNKWDSILPLDKLWLEYKRIIKDGGAIVLTSQQPFSSDLVTTNKIGFKCEWIWSKNKTTGYLNAKKHPLRKHESVLVFGKDKNGLKTYNPQFTIGKPYISHKGEDTTPNYGKQKPVSTINTGTRYPTTVIEFEAVKNTQHPTQKPVPLFEYLIKTYSNEGAIV